MSGQTRSDRLLQDWWLKSKFNQNDFRQTARYAEYKDWVSNDENLNIYEII